MKCDIIIIWKNNAKTNIANSDVFINTKSKNPTLYLTKNSEKDYEISLKLVRRIIIDPIWSKQSTLLPAIDDPAFYKFLL